LSVGFFGSLDLYHGSALTVSGALQNDGFVSLYGSGSSLTASGYAGTFDSGLTVGNGATADLRTGANDGFQNLVNIGGAGTLVNGTYVVGGTLKIDGASDGLGGALGIQTIDNSAGLTLSGTGQILYGPGAGTNALSQLAENDGGLSLVRGAVLSVSGSLGNGATGANAEIDIEGAGSKLTVNGLLFNGFNGVVQMNSGGTMQVNGPLYSDGGILLDGLNTKLKAQGGFIDLDGGLILSNGATADFRSGNTDTFASLGSGTLTSGATLTGGVLNSGTYIIGGTFIYDPTSDGTGGAILAIGSSAEIALLPGGQVLTGSGDGTNALSTLQENDGVFGLGGTTFATTPGTGTFENSGFGGIIMDTASLFVNGDVQNDGNFFINSSSGVTATGNFTQSDGTTTVDGVVLATQVSVTGGTLDGTGSLDSSVTQSGGTVQPGDDPGVLTITGDYTQLAGILDIEFSGRTTPGFDWSQLDVLGTATLGGEIDLDLLNSVDFQAGDVFDILNAGTLIDNGATFSLPTLSNGLEFIAVFNGNELDLDVVAATAPEPASLLLSFAALAALLCRRRNLFDKRSI
jgi:hypothetical protein